MTAPVPQAEDFASGFLDGLKVHEIRLQVCSDCRRSRLPTTGVCTECLSEEYRWVAVDGKGEVHTFVWYMQNLDPEFDGIRELEAPYNVSVIHLDAGPKLIANVLQVSFAELAVGMRVHPTFDTSNEGAPRLGFVPCLRPVD